MSAMPEESIRAAIDALPPLRDVIAANELRATKALGQNFLLDLNLTARIARAAGDLSGCNVVEIGPGPGGLTRALLAETGATRVIAIERDARCVAALGPLVEAACGRLELIEGDAMQADVIALAAPPRAIVANLPYNVATPLLIGWLRNITEFRSITAMFQKEVVDRITAAPGSKSYSRLAVITQAMAQADQVMTLPPSAFTPPPKVHSAVARITARHDADIPPPVFSALEKVTAAAFGQRRKMVKSSLSSLPGDVAAMMDKCDIAPTARAEAIEVEKFVALARLLADQAA